MLETLEIRNAQGALLSFPLEDVSDGFVLADIQGLEPVDATLVSSSFANMDGEQYHSSRRTKRNIILKIELKPDFVVDSVRDLRKRLYEFFMPKTEVQLRFILDDVTANIMGRIETFACPLFVRDPEANISLLCFDSDFVDINTSLLEGLTTDTATETPIPYEGTVETGILFTLNVDRTIGSFDIEHRGPDDVVRTLSFASSLIAGDVVTINTNVGEKIATRLRGGITTSLVYAVSPTSKWIELGHGENHIRVYAVGAGVPFEIQYANRYGGL
jgi:hypothetical protein